MRVFALFHEARPSGDALTRDHGTYPAGAYAVCFHLVIAAMPHGRDLGLTLVGLVPVFLLLTLGFAFTIFGELAALLAITSLVAGVAVFMRSVPKR